MGTRLGPGSFCGLLASTLLLLAGCGGSSSNTNTSTSPSPNPVPAPTAPQTSTNVLTFHNDIARTGQNLTETVLTHASVNSSSFGKLFFVAVDGKIDAQPLYVSQLVLSDQQPHSVVFAATEHDSVYAFDAKTGGVYWHVTLLAAGESPSDDLGCGQVTPEIGITATPVIDLAAGAHGTIYLLAMSRDSGGNYHHRLHALDLTTGQEEFGGPVEIAASYPGTGDNSTNGQVVFDPRQYNSRPGLLLLNGVVYTGWGSHCDFPPYTGWLIGYDRLTLKQTTVFDFAPNGIGNAFVRLNVVNGQLAVEDYWTMSNTVSESSQDEDLGSGGVMLLPDLTNASGQTIKLGTGAGKDGKLYVFDRTNLGKFNPQSNSTLYQELDGALSGNVFSTPAWFNGTVYYGAAGDRIRAFTLSAARLTTPPASATDTFFEFPGATPAISANGTSDPILWAVENANPAVLHAYDATDLAHELYNSNQASSGRDQFGAGNKFIVPTIADGRVFVGTTNGVAVFGPIQ